jgi:lon-related putative ATP-dependent protease
MPDTTLELTPSEITFSIPEAKIRCLRANGAANPIIGQDRAISALELGLGIRADGFNIFIMGASGTGRRTVLKALLANYKANASELQDIAYTYNFARPLEPKAIFLKPGEGAAFRKGLQQAIESIRKQALGIAKSEGYAAASRKILSASDAEENQLLADFESRVAGDGFKLIQIKDDEARSMDLVPIYKGNATTFDDLQNLVARGKFPRDRLNALRESYYRSLDQMSELFSEIRDKRRAADKKIRTLKSETISPIVDAELTPLKERYAAGTETATAAEFLQAVRDDLIARVPVYSEPFKSPRHKKAFFGRYAINLVCENPEGKDYVIQEEVPTFANLFGSIESPSANGDDIAVNGHLRLRAGAIHRASGGFLVLRLQDLLLEEGAWPYLKRVLQSGKIEIQTPPTGNHVPSILKPQVLPARLKVVIIGGEHSYDFLYQEDPDFQKLFKICAEFDSVMPRTDENMAKYIAYIEELGRRSGALPFADSGLARILSYAARLAEYRSMLTTRFTQISDLVTEANYQARLMGEQEITQAVVSKAIEHRQYLQRLPEEKYADMIRSREILLDVTGTRVGKMNGLAVHDRGYHAFGIPVAVTAQAAPGDTGVINIERESGLSGEIYDKAHLIIQGLLQRKYAKDIPLAVSASICFEQSYTEVDGDSASCAEFFALVSAIAQEPLRQDIAVTGSLNQLGDVQPVGGVPEKIEGFFDACSILGLTGGQGVIIPRRNLDSLLPSDRLQQAVEDGLFHIWAIDTVDEGLEIISGIPAADFDRKVCAVLANYYERMRKFFK